MPARSRFSTIVVFGLLFAAAAVAASKPSRLAASASNPEPVADDLVWQVTELPKDDAVGSRWVANAVSRVTQSDDWSLPVLADLAVRTLRDHPEIDHASLLTALSELRARYDSQKQAAATGAGGPFARQPSRAVLSVLFDLLASARKGTPADRANELLLAAFEQRRSEVEHYLSYDGVTEFGEKAFGALYEEAKDDSRLVALANAVFAPALGAMADSERTETHLVDSDLNLILITIDTFRATEAGFLGYGKPTTPNLDALAARSVVFERAYAMASYTGKALAPMVIGKYPSETLRDGGHLDTYFAGNTFLAERLRRADVFTMGVASHWYFHEGLGLTQGCDAFDLSAEPPAGQYTRATSAQLTDAAIKLLAVHAGSHRFFLWAHYFDPHSEYIPHAGAPDFADPSRPHGWRQRALYDGELWFTDQAIGRLLDYVKTQPWGAATVVVVTADHGEVMVEHGMEFRHGIELWEPLVRVPLLLFVPGLAPHRVPVKRSMIDLVPTLLDLMRVPQPPRGELSGRSLARDLVAAPGAAYEERDVYFDMPEGPHNRVRRGLIHGPTPGMKLVYLGGGQYRLFDLANDPDENEDLSRNRSRFSPMLSALQSMRSTLREIRVERPASVVR